jgi:hypothetical protein
MAVTEPGPGGGQIQQRIKNILFTPSEEWDRIDTEPATLRGLYVGYACILAAIGPVARLIGEQIFGVQGFLQTIHPALIPTLVAALVGYGLNLAGVYVLALVIDALAPSFGGTRSRIQALKIAVFSWTAAWIFAVFQLVPQVSGLSIIGIYSLYLMYLGIPKLMKSPEDKALVYSILTIAVAMAIWLVVLLVSGAILTMV